MGIPARSARVFSTRFDSVAAVALEGGQLTGTATLAPGVLTGDGASSSGLVYRVPDLNAFFRMGGSVRIRLRHTNDGGDATTRRALSFARDGDVNFNFVIATTHSTGATFAQIQTGAGNTYYSTTSTLTSGAITEVVVTWNPSGAGRLEMFFDSVSVSSDVTAGAAALTAESSPVLHVGRWSNAANAWVGEIYAVDIFVNRTVLTTGEMTKLASNLLLPPLLAQSRIHLPLRSSYLDTTTRTRNAGTLGGYALLGDGSTATTFPTLIEPEGMKVDGGDYIDTGFDPAIDHDTPFSVALVAKPRWVTFISQGVISNLDSSISGGRGMEFGFYGTAAANNVRLELFSSSSFGINVNAVLPVFYSGVVVCTYSGSNTAAGCRIYVDGLSLTLTATANNLGSNTTLSGRPLLIGCSHSGVNKGRFTNSNGVFACPTYWDFELTPTQVQQVTAELAKRARI